LLNAPPQQSATLQALHRRVVLDEARSIIINRYNFTIDQLRLGGYDTYSQYRAALLSDSALMMIFDSWRHSVRDDGNDAAHHASEGEVSLAVLGAGLSNAQRESLQQIYKFTHNKVPQLN
jgi:hypothetical protein